MNEVDLSQKWTREQFEQWKTQGIFGPALTYEEYLAFRAEQEESVTQQREALKAYYGDYPNEQPPELTPEEDQLLSEVWAELAREREQTKIAA